MIRLPDQLAGNIKLSKTASGRIDLPIASKWNPKWGPVQRKAVFSAPVSGHQLQPGKYIVYFAVRGSKIHTMKIGLTGGSKLFNFASDSLLQADSWTPYTLSYEVKKFQKWSGIRFEFLADSKNEDAWGEIEDVELIKQN